MTTQKRQMIFIARLDGFSQAQNGKKATTNNTNLHEWDSSQARNIFYHKLHEPLARRSQ